jgi:CheY-like chemotaxis protein
VPRVQLLNSEAGEAKLLIKQLRASGYTVGGHDEGSVRALRQSPPHALVIDLARSPAHGRHLAMWMRSQESIRSIPIVFVDGDAEKVEKIRAELPDAIYTSRAKLASALKRAKPLASPALGYGNRTIAQKLGIRDGTRVAVIGAPPGYANLVGPLPPGASLEEDPEEALPVTLWFVHDPEVYLAELPRMRQLAAARSRLCVIYPKQHTAHKGRDGRITQSFIREFAEAMGLVAYRTCSVNKSWSGTLLSLKKQR